MSSASTRQIATTIPLNRLYWFHVFDCAINMEIKQFISGCSKIYPKWITAQFGYVIEEIIKSSFDITQIKCYNRNFINVTNSLFPNERGIQDEFK